MLNAHQILLLYLDLVRVTVLYILASEWVLLIFSLFSRDFDAKKVKIGRKWQAKMLLLAADSHPSIGLALCENCQKYHFVSFQGK